MADVQGFVEGDTHTAFRVIFTDENNQRIDIAGTECRLFARGQLNADRPTSNPSEGSWNGVLGVLSNPAQGEVDFFGIGGLCTLDDNRSQDYDFMVRVVFPDATILYTYPIHTFVVIQHVSEAGF